MLSRSPLSAIVMPTMAVAAFALATGAGGQTPSNGGAAPHQQPAAPATILRDDAALPVAPASEVPSDIAWGPVREVQAGVRARLWAASHHASRFIFDVYLRNCTKHTLNATCLSYSGLSVPTDSSYGTEVQSDLIYCSPHLRDSDGRRVDVSFRLGTEDRQYAIEPGQVVYISHWMLRTINRQAKGTQRANYTQVALVEPGKHRMSCDVSVSWGSKGERRAMLRTGEAAFDVTADDVKAE